MSMPLQFTCTWCQSNVRNNSNASTGYSLFAIHIQEIIDTEFTCLSIVSTAYYLYTQYRQPVSICARASERTIVHKFYSIHFFAIVFLLFFYRVSFHSLWLAEVTIVYFLCQNSHVSAFKWCHLMNLPYNLNVLDCLTFDN